MNPIEADKIMNEKLDLYFRCGNDQPCFCDPCYDE